jgi:hypothetical protein
VNQKKKTQPMKRENNSLLEDSANQKKENSARESIARGFTVASQKIEKQLGENKKSQWDSANQKKKNSQKILQSAEEK